MFDLFWINRILKGIFNMTTPNLVEWISHDQKMQMRNELQPLNCNKSFSVEERDYLWSIADYFNLKTYGNSKMLKEQKHNASVIIV